MKKRYLFLGAGGALLFMIGGAGAAMADNGPHISSAATEVGLFQVGTAVGADKCAGCHRVHTAKSNDEMLLKTTTQEALCFSCHGSTGAGAATNVVDGVGYSSATRTAGSEGALRGGGFDYALINATGATKEMYLTSSGSLSRRNQDIPALPAANMQPVTSNHSLGAAGTAWGNGAIGSGVGKSVTLECGSCHDPHGNGNYRILKPMPADSGYVPAVKVPAKPEVLNPDGTVLTAAVPAVMTPTTGIAIPDATAKVYTTTNYWLAGDRNVPKLAGGVPDATGLISDGFISNVADWCTTCHTRYNAPTSASRKPPIAGAPALDPVYTYKHTSNEGSKVVGNKNCVTCHVAHGSNAKMGPISASLPQPDGTQAQEHAVGAAGSRLLRVDNRGICIMCHNF